MEKLCLLERLSVSLHSHDTDHIFRIQHKQHEDTISWTLEWLDKFVDRGIRASL